MDDYETPMSVVVIDGSIVIRGPGRMEGAFAIEAAEASAHAILAAALQARHGFAPRSLAKPTADDERPGGIAAHKVESTSPPAEA